MAIPGWTEAKTEEFVGNYLVAEAGGQDDETIRASLKLTHGKFRQLKREAYSRESAHMRGQSTEDVFLQFRMRQERLAGLVMDMLPGFKKLGQAAPQVSAIKVISDIHDRVIKTGQEMGIIERAPDRVQAHSDNMFANMSAAVLRKWITTLAGEFVALDAKYGSKNIVNVEFEKTYYDPPPALPAADKHNRSSTGRAAGARRRKVAKQKAV